MTDPTIKVQCMKFLFARPSSLHDDPTVLVMWGEDGLPKVYRHRAGEVVGDENLLIALYDEIIAREQD